ncbi:MAG: hypothetical protein ACE5IB_02480 [Candidatus Geothermarchaeales archaeon]
MGGEVARPLLLSARQIAIAAIFGAIAMITTGLGLALPGYLPLVNFELQGTFIIIATMAAGPIAGTVVAFLVSLVSAVGVISFPFYIPHILVFAVAYRWIWKQEDWAVKTVAFWAVSAIALFIQYWGWWWLYAAVFQVMTVEAMFYYNMAAPYVVFLLIWALLPYVVFVTAPDFAKPRWNAPYVTWFAALATVIAIGLGSAWWPGGPVVAFLDFGLGQIFAYTGETWQIVGAIAIIIVTLAVSYYFHSRKPFQPKE